MNFDTVYKITLADGTELSDLRLNGNNFVSLDEISPAIFTDNLSPVTISDGEHEEVHEHMELVQVAKMGVEYWVILRDLTRDELARIKTQADIEYLAMMTGVEL